MRAALPLLLLVAGCDDGGSDYRPIPPAMVEQPQPAKSDWQIGPWLGRVNYSKNCPLHPTANPDGTFWFDIGPCEPHYVTGPTGSLTGKSKIGLRFKIEGDGVIHGAGCAATSPSRVVLFFALPFSADGKSIDDSVQWSKDGGRWWSLARSAPLAPGEFTLEADLTDKAQWKTVVSSGTAEMFAQDKAKAGRVGFTFANCSGAGHGAVATKPMRFTVLESTIADQ